MKVEDETSQFVGLWAPTLLLLGLYNKIVKVAGSDSVTREPGRPIGGTIGLLRG